MHQIVSYDSERLCTADTPPVLVWVGVGQYTLYEQRLPRSMAEFILLPMSMELQDKYEFVSLLGSELQLCSAKQTKLRPTTPPPTLHPASAHSKYTVPQQCEPNKVVSLMPYFALYP